jgi:ActR/RegA family two-component response regulator
VFNNAIDGFFLTHYDFLAKPEDADQIAAMLRQSQQDRNNRGKSEKERAGCNP